VPRATRMCQGDGGVVTRILQQMCQGDGGVVTRILKVTAPPSPWHTLGTERGYKVISCDISDIALERVKENVPGSQTMAVNMLEGLPFDNSTAKIIIADLCLHYFYWKDTIKIVNEIKRVMIHGGHLLGRVNSTKDTNHGAGQGDIIEENYYVVEGNMKRFFNREQIEMMFIGWEFCNMSEYQMDRYKYPKILWEYAVKRIY
jgi:SAM-dependent methyltransferase